MSLNSEIKKTAAHIAGKLADIRRDIHSYPELGFEEKRTCRKITGILKNIGLDGVEVLSPHHSLSSVMHAQHLVARLNLIASGGSDYHRSENSRFLQNCYDYWQAESRFLPGVDRIIK